MTIKKYYEYINKKYKVTFSEHSVPELRCAQCHNGKLTLDNKSLVFDETQKSKALHNDPHWEPSFIEYLYSCSFVCDSCNGRTFSCGEGYYAEYHSQELDGEGEEYPVFKPHFFSPFIPLFLVHKKCPESVLNNLNKSFNLAWADVSAAANKLRIAVEELLVEVEPKLAEFGKLHARITEFEKTQPEIAQLLMAVKWLGNDASHKASLEEHDLAFAYEVMELAINKIFDDSESKLKELVTLVNLNRGKPFIEW